MPLALDSACCCFWFQVIGSIRGVVDHGRYALEDVVQVDRVRHSVRRCKTSIQAFVRARHSVEGPCHSILNGKAGGYSRHNVSPSFRFDFQGSFTAVFSVTSTRFAVPPGRRAGAAI